MTVLSYLGEWGSSAKEGGIGIGHDNYDGRGDGVQINFPVPIPKSARGHIIITEDSFERLAFAMIASHREVAIKAFGSALQADEEEVLKMFGIRIKRTQEAAE
jgi:hypothetical protein